MPNRPTAAAVIYAKDVARVSAFYSVIPRLEVIHAERGHVILESPGFQLVVVSVPDSIAASIEITSPPERRVATPIKLAFDVPSIAAVREAAPKLGGGLNSVEQEWRFREHVVCDGHDPEGNVFQLREQATAS